MELLPTTREWMEATLSLIFPPCCAYCGLVLDVDDVRPQLCRDCQANFFTPPAAGCPRCGAFATRRNPQGTTCVACRHMKLSFDRVFSLGNYSGELQKSVVRMKSESGQPLAAAVGRQLASLLDRSGHTEQIDLATCIPKHWLKRLLTGINSPEVLMSGLANQANIPAASNLLICRRKIRKQAMLSPDQRRRNVHHAWTVSRRYDISDASILLVDDIMTTGATANAAAKALRRAGAKEITVAVVARAHKMQ